MKLICENHGTVQFRITDDKSSYELLMDYDDQLEQYQLAIRNGTEGEVEPLDPIRRRDGEHDETYFDRACALAHRIYLNRIAELIELNSRNDRKHYLLGRVREKLNHMELTIEHFDNDEPTEDELGRLNELLILINRADTNLTEIS